MNIRRTVWTILLLSTLSSWAVAEDTVWKVPLEPFQWTCYADVGGGVGFVSSHAVPVLDSSVGFSFHEWWTVGGFVSAVPLSNYGHVNLGLSVANREAAFGLSSGTELWFTPWREALIHPLIGLRLGGISSGWLIDADGKEGYEGSTGDRATFASVHAGTEVNLTSHFRLLVRGGWKFSGNQEFLGISKGALGGPELVVGIRTVWKTLID